jgi:hypothetical protein
MALVLNGTNGATIPTLTTTAKLALSATVGQIVFDSTLGKMCVYNGTVWQTITSV